MKKPLKRENLYKKTNNNNMHLSKNKTVIFKKNCVI